MKKIDHAAQTMATSYVLARPLDVYAKRIKRIQKDAAEEVYYRLKRRDNTTGPVYAEREWKSSLLARGLRDGVEEFKKRHPEYADELENIIAHQRKCRRNYVAFSFEELPEENYYKILEDVGIPKKQARTTLKDVMKISEYLDELKQPIKLLME